MRTGSGENVTTPSSSALHPKFHPSARGGHPPGHPPFPFTLTDIMAQNYKTARLRTKIVVKSSHVKVLQGANPGLSISRALAVRIIQAEVGCSVLEVGCSGARRRSSQHPTACIRHLRRMPC